MDGHTEKGSGGGGAQWHKFTTKMADVWGDWLQQHKTVIQRVVVTTACLLVLTVLLPSYFHIVVIIWTCFCGVFICYSTITPEYLAPNLLATCVREKKIIPPNDDELALLKKICPVCGRENCNRHRPELNIVALHPWTDLKLPRRVDAALEEFLNLVLKGFIYSWYKDLSQDEAFIDELKSSLRFIASVLLRRLQKVDIPSLVLQKILKAAIRHLHFYLEVKRKAPEDADLQQAVLDFYRRDLHCAVRNRRTELDYLKCLSERLFPYILPLQSLKCRSLCVLLREILAGAILLPSLDVLADPDIVNNLLLIFFDNSPPPESEPSTPHSPLLATFARPLHKNDSCLHLELSDILEDPEVLFPFMQFLKAEASVNVLQFYLSVDEFNSKILTPELTKEQLRELHQQLQEMYRHYCHPTAAVDRIQFDDDIVAQLKQICDGPPEGVVKLQTTTPLFRAHEHTYDLLENTFLPLFHQSDDYYQMLCGERLPTRYLQRSLSNSSLNAKSNGSNPSVRSARRSGDALSRIGSKIKGVFKTNPVPKLSKSVEDGRLLDDVDYGAEETDPNGFEGEDFVSFRMLDGGPLRDLSAWRVTIPDILTRPDPENPKKVYHSFLIDVRRVDVLENDFEASKWKVERRYHEFYVLEQKLTEFHGEFDDCQLPPKKAFGTKNRDFLETRKSLFELYLQKLLTIPNLRGSELLYTFLSSELEFASSIFPDISLGKMVKSGAMKLVKEKGQHLDPFLQSFLVSTEIARPRPSRFTDKDSDTVSISSEKMASTLFENNANVDLQPLPAMPKAAVLEVEVPTDGLTDTIIYLAERLFHSPNWLLQILLSIRIIARTTVDKFVDWYLGRKLERVTEEHRITKVIHLLRDAIFFDDDPPRSDEEKMERQTEALKELKDFIPKVFALAIGSERHKAGTALVFDVLQHPKLNKQLVYLLLDLALEELFPELTQKRDPLTDIYWSLFRKEDSS